MGYEYDDQMKFHASLEVKGIGMGLSRRAMELKYIYRHYADAYSCQPYRIILWSKSKLRFVEALPGSKESQK
jgi:hypothetical protein